VNHIYQQPQFGEDWFTYPQLYSRFVRELADESHMVEVGCWKGKSIAYLAVEIVNSGKRIKVDAVDTWSEMESEAYHKTDTYVKTNTLYQLFCSNISPVSGIVNPIRMKSADATNLYGDASVDVVFIDACHEYDCVKEDINAWLPKVKEGGYLAGHDYSWSQDVARAVNELLSDIQETEGCWVYRKPKTS
jgi:SAM-dependent methyltransferase